MKKILSILFSSVLTFTFFGVVHAGGLTLNMIGELDVSGTSYAQYWYTGDHPNLSGEAPAGNEVTLTVNGEVYGTATADASGNWNHQVMLNEGDNTVSISTEGMDPYTFTLTMGSPPEGTGGMAPSDMPAAGNGVPTIFFLGLGIVAISASVFSFKEI